MPECPKCNGPTSLNYTQEGVKEFYRCDDSECEGIVVVSLA